MGSAFSPVANIPGGMTQLQQVVCSGSQSSIAFTNIPSNYSDLMVVLSGRLTGSASLQTIYVKFNSDATAANYISQYVTGSSTATAAGAPSSTTSGAAITSVGGTGVATQPVMGATLTIPNYAGTVNNKAFICPSYYISATANQANSLYLGGEWFSTAPINRIDFSIPSGTLLDGFTATLYGLGTGPGNSRGYAEVTANPTTNLVDGYKVYRTDLDLLIVYKAALGKWLTVQEYTMPLGIDTGAAATVSATGNVGYVTIPSDYAVYVTSAFAWVLTGATNNGSNFYSYAFQWSSNGGVATNLATFNTSADAASTRVVHAATAINTVLTSTAFAFILTASGKTGAPSNQTLLPSVFKYRLIVP